MNEAFSLSIVIPAFNEKERLPDTLENLSEFLKSHPSLQGAEVIIVDDGSSDDTSSKAQEFTSKLNVKVHRYEKNRGKGYATRTGLALAKNDWILFADADNSTPWSETARFVQILERDPSIDVLIGSRGLNSSQITLEQHPARKFMGKTFNLLMRTITGLPFKDTQCGFKLMRSAKVQGWLDQLRIDRFAWDVEFLLLAKQAGLQIQEQAVEWHHCEASRVHPIKDSLEMLFSVVMLRLRRIFSKCPKQLATKNSH